MTWYDPRTWFTENDESPCDHPTFVGDGDDTYWYTYLEYHADRTYWSARDHTYIKLRPVVRLFVCRHCGEAKVIHTSEEVGGPEGLIRHEDVRRGIQDRPDATTGGWKNVSENTDDPITAHVEMFHESKKSVENRDHIPPKYEDILDRVEESDE